LRTDKSLIGLLPHALDDAGFFDSRES